MYYIIDIYKEKSTLHPIKHINISPDHWKEKKYNLRSTLFYGNSEWKRYQEILYREFQ